ncbi:lysylphosphatidylglycerol synthase domain-containing protein [Demequina oxidasica]|uniref:lysylphosphatidylglycerol synthase domain-containing protein n=1 Tax=Demequina oxidasica TaxID=676199 RepID=UPI00078302DA|nr:lysylphosphatidylglycerol synthase domain-containing protein [Demequina oxidasica]
MANRKRLLRTGLGVLVIGVVAYFFAKALADNWDAIQDADLSWGWWAPAALVLFVAAVAISGWLWGRIVAVLSGKHLPVRESIRVHFSSWLLKYIPGQAGFVVNKVAWGKRRGLSRLLVLISVVYENAFLLLGSTVPMLAILLVARAGDGEITHAVWFAVAAVVPLIVLLHPAVFHRIVNLLARRTLKREVPPEYFLRTGSVWKYQLAFLLPRVINGIGVVAIAIAVADAAPSSWLPLVAAYALAGAVGILAVFVPSGLGVRESVFVLFATPYLGLEQAIIVSLAARVLATVADLLIAGAYGLLTASAKRRGELPAASAAGADAVPDNGSELTEDEKDVRDA